MKKTSSDLEQHEFASESSACARWGVGQDGGRARRAMRYMDGVFLKPRAGNVWKSAFLWAHSRHSIFFVLDIVSFASLRKGGRLGREALDAYAPDHTRRRPYLCGAETRVAYGPTATPATAAAFFIPW
jgi:predicted GNAT superfamily acetyltransferase